MSPSTTMRAVVITGPGSPDVLHVEERIRRVPGPRDVRIKIRTSGVNRADLLQREGRYPGPPGWPEDIPGLECAGVVDAVGEEVTRWRVTDRVMGILGGGGYAESIVTHEDSLVPVPKGISLADAGAIPEVFMTAFDAVWLQMGLAEGETLLVHAVGSGVGTAALQLARAFGCRTVGTSRTQEKLERATALGLDERVLASDAEGGSSSWADRVMEVTGGHGADVILDLVGGTYLEGNQRVMARGGRHVIVGVPGGRDGKFDLRLLMAKRGTIRGTVLRARPLAEKIELARVFEERVIPLFEQGRVKPVIDQVLPPEEAPAAHRLLEANANFGKVLLDWE